jgi:hypothetical protein
MGAKVRSMTKRAPTSVFLAELRGFRCFFYVKAGWNPSSSCVENHRNVCPEIRGNKGVTFMETDDFGISDGKFFLLGVLIRLFGLKV